MGRIVASFGLHSFLVFGLAKRRLTPRHIDDGRIQAEHMKLECILPLDGGA
jgi:hypothetical protein